ncbi:sensor histidine kinase [Dactylosporangium sp. NPDC051541]|uniref:sensor histidine kinase n=1 Tax=Dactylosporangium sp. NPDC051541 TaxID=3363977 RepID=UPI0037B808CC
MRNRRWLDAGLILLLAVGSLLWNDALALLNSPDDKKLLMYGSVDAWRVHGAWWFVAGAPALTAIVLRHRWPLAALLLAAGSVGIHLFDPILGLSPVDAAALVAMFALAGSAGSRRTVVGVLIVLEAVLLAVCLAAGLFRGTRGQIRGSDKMLSAMVNGDASTLVLDCLKTAIVPGLLLAATWAVADSARTRRVHLADLRREHEQRTALAVASERGRITRELHDVVAHGLAVMVVQAQGAKAMLAKQPERTEAALTNIVTTGRASLAEMRRLLGLVRTDASYSPQPSLATLPDLIDRVRDSGTRIDFRIAGEPATLAAVIELAAYRIVQEALTNTLKHAPPGTGSIVVLDFGPAELGIRIVDDGAPVADPAQGNGLRGITERVAALGGVLRAGPIAGGGFEVAARIPTAARLAPVP